MIFNPDFIGPPKPWGRIDRYGRPTCCKSVWRGWSYNYCDNAGKKASDGRYLCGIHSPEADARRADRGKAKRAEWDAKLDRDRRQHAFEAATIGAIRKIGAGHHDPRALANEVLAME